MVSLLLLVHKDLDICPNISAVSFGCFSWSFCILDLDMPELKVLRVPTGTQKSGAAPLPHKRARILICTRTCVIVQEVSNSIQLPKIHSKTVTFDQTQAGTSPSYRSLGHNGHSVPPENESHFTVWRTLDFTIFGLPTEFTPKHPRYDQISLRNPEHQVQCQCLFERPIHWNECCEQNIQRWKQTQNSVSQCVKQFCVTSKLFILQKVVSVGVNVRTRTPRKLRSAHTTKPVYESHGATISSFTTFAFFTTSLIA